MFRAPKVAFLARLTLAVFVFVQLSPLGLSWCQTGDGGLHVGCCCNYCLDSEAAAMPAKAHDACCSAGEQCPACGHDLASAGNKDHAGPVLAAPCCDHLQMQYAGQHTTLRAPLRASSAAVLLATPALTLAPAQLSAAVNLQRAHAPPGRMACSALSGASPLPLRI